MSRPDPRGPVGEPESHLRARINRLGPVPYSELVATALYGPGGFYTTGRGAGRDRDFLTSPELGTLFGAVMARAVDAAWETWGRPDPWVVVEAGAGSGALAAAVLAAGPACAPALRYVAVESSPALRAVAAGRLPLEDPAQLLAPRALADYDGDTDEEDTPPTDSAPGRGPLVAVLGELPVGPFTGMVIANELLDNLPFDLYQRAPGGWIEIRVGLADDGDALVEVEVPAHHDVAARLDLLAPDSPAGGRVPWQAEAAAWLRRALTVLSRGRVVVIDYARPTAELAQTAPRRWLRTYRSGGLSGDPMRRIGEQDITTDVALDQLTPASRVSDQGAWLAAHGLADFEAQAAAAWRAGAGAGDLAALAARSRVAEAATLRDPSGLGAFTVCEWDKD